MTRIFFSCTRVLKIDPEHSLSDFDLFSGSPQSYWPWRIWNIPAPWHSFPNLDSFVSVMSLQLVDSHIVLGYHPRWALTVSDL